MRDTQTYAVQIEQLSKSFGRTRALNDINLHIQPGEMVALIGPSGAGKSTLLKNVSGLVVADQGPNAIRVLGNTVQQNGDLNLNIRSIRTEVGYIFQQFNLVGRLSLLTNVLIGDLARIPTWRTLPRLFSREEKYRAMHALSRVGMADYASQAARTLSGGQQQRAAIARALVQQAKIILADEPIASLDPESARKVMQILLDINQEDAVTVLVSLHQVNFAMRFCKRCIGMRDGEVVFDGPTSELSTSLLREIYGSEFGDVEEGVDMFSQYSRAQHSRVAAE